MLNSGLVDKNFVMDPETDDLLPNGWLLAPGMKVLIENRFLVRLRKNLADWEVDNSYESNRWAVVSDISYYENRVVLFTATYEDGTKKRRQYGDTIAWYVKKDSIPDPVVKEEKAAKLHAEIYRVLNESYGAVYSSQEAFLNHMTNRIMLAIDREE